MFWHKLEVSLYCWNLGKQYSTCKPRTRNTHHKDNFLLKLRFASLTLTTEQRVRRMKFVLFDWQYGNNYKAGGNQSNANRYHSSTNGSGRYVSAIFHEAQNINWHLLNLAQCNRHSVINETVLLKKWKDFTAKTIGTQNTH